MNPPIRLPPQRDSANYEVLVSRTRFFMTIAMSEDGLPVDVWIDIHKEGSPQRAQLSTIARLVAELFRHHAELGRVLEILADLPFEPSGLCVLPDESTIHVDSLLEAVARTIHLAVEQHRRSPPEPRRRPERPDLA